MTEAEWLACADPESMLDFLRCGGKASDRKLRLFACACCRRIWHLLTDQRPRGAVDLAERYADGGASAAELEEAMSASVPSAWGSPTGGANWSAQRALDTDASRTAAPMATAAAVALVTTKGTPRRTSNRPSRKWKRLWESTVTAEQQAQSALVRDLFTAFRPVAVGPVWLTRRAGAVPSLAQAAYEERELPSGTLDPTRLAVLADALEDAGCSDAELLGHLRGPGPHVRGCWAVDLILDKG
jgi:hypothetical protein